VSDEDANLAEEGIHSSGSNAWRQLSANQKNVAKAIDKMFEQWPKQ
jgi:hypothetical protein